MEYRGPEVKAGFFILVSLMVLFAFLFAVTGIDLWSEKLNYTVRFQYVGGIEVGSVVRLGGMDVGKVIALNFPDDSDTRIELLLEVKKGTPIREDSKAYITSVGLMGAPYIEITTGSPVGSMLAAGESIRSEDVTAFAQMAGPISEISDKLTELLASVNEVFNAENRANISTALANLNKIMADNSEHMKTVMTNMSEITLQTTETLERINDMVVRSDTAFAENLDRLGDVLVSTKALLQNLDQTLHDVDSALITNQDDYQNIIRNLTTLTQNIEEFSQIIKEQPWSLIRKNAPPERKLP